MRKKAGPLLLPVENVNQQPSVSCQKVSFFHFTRPTKGASCSPAALLPASLSGSLHFHSSGSTHHARPLRQWPASLERGQQSDQFVSPPPDRTECGQQGAKSGAKSGARERPEWSQLAHAHEPVGPNRSQMPSSGPPAPLTVPRRPPQYRPATFYCFK